MNMWLAEQFREKKVLVVGGSGFIGRHLVKLLGEHDARLVVLGKSKEIKNEWGLYIAANTADMKTLEPLKQHAFEYVFNLSGYVEHQAYFQNGRDVINAHFVGLLNLIDILDRSKLKAFVQVGSSDEYGSQPAPQNEAFRENPISPYSVAKAASTQLMQMLAQQEGFPSIVVRPFLVYGPGQQQNRLVPQVIINCLEGNSMDLSEGKQLRDFCYIDDLIDALILAATKKCAFGNVINIGSGDPISIRQAVAIIQNKIGSGTFAFGVRPYRTGENMKLYADIKEAKRLLGWLPQTSLDVGLEKTIRWYKEELSCFNEVKT